MKKKINYGNHRWLHKLLRTMKLIIYLMVISATQMYAVSSFAQKTKLDIKVENSSIEDLLKNIELNSTYRFFYRSNDLLDKQDINLDLKDKSVQEILDAILPGMSLSYEVFDNYIAVKRAPIIVKGEKQQIVITGVVTDKDGYPLPGVNIVEKGTTNGTVTNLDGNYTINVSSPDAILIFSFVGFLSEEIVVGGQTTIDITLVEDIQSLEEVVVIGYGVQKKSVVTGAISSVKSEDIVNTSITRTEQALQARTAGVQVISGSGSPGAGMKVRIRGYSSNGSSEPLYIVDGMRTTDISNLDPNNISNMEVLKDAASAAIYGAEGGNGVVIITTKTGTSGKSQVNYELQYTLQSLGHTPEVMNAVQYADYMEEAGLIIDAPTDINTNWIDEAFETTPMMKHYLSLTGGSDKGSYILSLSYLDQDGIVKGSQDTYKRYSGMFNADYKLYDWLKVGNNITFNHAKRNSIAENSEYAGLISSTIMLDPLTPVKYTGELPSHVQDLLDAGKTLLKAPDGNYWGISKYVNGDNINTFVNRDRSKTTNNTSGVVGSFFSEISPFEGFVFTSRVGLDVNYFNTKTYERVYYYNADMYNDYSSVEDVILYKMFWQFENFATYTKSISNHNFSLLAGMSSSEYKLKLLSAYGSPLSKDQESYADLDYITSNTNDVVEGNTTFDRKLSYFGRLSYDYDNKYLLQAIIRRDAAGLSILPDDTRWGTFPSISAGWVISNESFFPETFISNLKLRASWGKNGSVSNLGDYQYASTISSSYLYPSGDGAYITGSRPEQLSNNSLRWETSVQTDIGLDLRAFDDRLTLTVDYFNKKTTDLITDNTPPLEAGNDASPVNGGDVLNKGFEFELGYRGKIGDFSYSFNANLATLKNEVVYLNPTITRLEGATVNSEVMTAFEEGLPIWYFYGYKTTGIDPATGDAVFEDVSGDGVINDNDKTYIGSSIPELTYGCYLNLEYKGVDFSLVGQGSYGNDILMGMVRVDRPTANRYSLFYTDRWTPENTGASRPSATVDANYWNSDGLIFDASYFRVKQLQLGYTLPSGFLNSIKVNKFRVYVSLEDYFTFTKYPGMDPEATSAGSFEYGSGDRDISVSSSQGIDRGFFPTARKMMFGVSVLF